MRDQPQAPTAMHLRVSTDALSERDRFDAWREEFALRIARVDVNTTDRAAFFADIDVLGLPSIAVSTTRVAPCSLTRTPSLVRDGDDGLVFIVCLEGNGHVRFGNDEVRLTQGDGTLVANHRLGGFFSSAPVKTCSIRVSRETARGFSPSLDRALLREARAGAPCMAILRAYVGGLMSASEDLTASAAHLMGQQIRELLANIVNPMSDLARADVYGGIKSARLKALLQEIEIHLTDPLLSAESIGFKLGLSARYVQQLMEGMGMTVSTYVRERRLTRAKELLRDPRYAHERIIDICMMSGFNDVSHFNRAYRARFGQTPKDARRTNAIA